MADEAKVLTAQERKFLDAYLSGDAAGNATAAALVAYEVSEDSAASYGYKVLNRPHIQAAIERYHQQMALPTSQLMSELRKVIEQDKSYQAKVAGLRLLAEMKGLVQRDKGKKPELAQIDPNVFDELASRLSKFESEDRENGRTET